MIVGGGSAGCVLAKRLSEEPGVTVCLLEAGPPDTNPLIHIPAGMLWLMHSKALNWQFNTQPEAALAGRLWPRGRTLGGGSAINAMCYTCGHASDYDEWAALGNDGWAYKDVLPYFKRAENYDGPPSAFHGKGGPLHVTDFPSPSPLTKAYVEAGMQAGFPFNPDFNGAEQEGVGVYQVTQKRGLRWSTARAYLNPARKRPNLRIITGAHAHRVQLDQGRATGVVYQQGKALHVATARREVILSAGALQSPQLLMLSGIGPKAQLQAHGIHTLVDLPGVGQNLQDHLDLTVTYQGKRGVQRADVAQHPQRALGLGRVAGLRARHAEQQRRGGLRLHQEHARRAHPGPAVPLHAGPLRDHGRDLRFMMGEGFTMHVCFLRPKSRGQITLASADPMAAPRIEANYLAHPEDLERMALGLRHVRKILQSPALDQDRGEELRPGLAVQTDEQVRAYIRASAETIYHPVGTCKMGADPSDPSHVVDAALRVHGVQGLRVVDASIMPTLVGGNTNAPAITIGEKAADLIKAQNAHQPWP